MPLRIFLIVMLFSTAAFSQMPKIEPGVSQELAKWRAAHYSDVRYKLNLTLERMSPVLKGTMEIRVKVSVLPVATGGETAANKDAVPPIILDWRKIKGFEERSTISNVTINGKPVVLSSSFSWPLVGDDTSQGSGGPPKGGTPNFGEINEHLVFSDGVTAGENVIRLDFTSPILPSGSAITRYVDKEDGAEYIYSLFVPSDASTAFPVFDQPDLKARFGLFLSVPEGWAAISNTPGSFVDITVFPPRRGRQWKGFGFEDTKPISTYVFAFAAGPFEKFEAGGGNLSGSEGASLQRNASGRQDTLPTGRVSASGPNGSIYVRKSQAAKFKPHAAEVFRLNREAVKYFEEYFDYKFPFPKYDLVLIPEFPFGGMEHAGATFLREASVIFPQEPTKNDHATRATLIFHEAAHQWFGDTVTMRWFDDLWLKEGFATFTAYKALEKIMPEMNAWKVFYERVKQGAYQTDSTRGTTPIYQEIPNLSAAKSAYGNIVYNKAPAFLRQAEFYLGEDKFRTAVRTFLKKHEFGNATWEDLIAEMERASNTGLKTWGNRWIRQEGLPVFRTKQTEIGDGIRVEIDVEDSMKRGRVWQVRTLGFIQDRQVKDLRMESGMNFDGSENGMFGLIREVHVSHAKAEPQFVFPNYKDYGYGIFLLDEKSREYVLKNIQNEKDPFLRSMMWGALWDSVREGELDPKEYVELVVSVLSSNFSLSSAAKAQAKACTLNCEDESTTALLLSRVGTALNYYIDDKGGNLSGSEGASLQRDASGRQDTLPTGRVSALVADDSGGKPSFRTASGGDDLRSRVEDMLIAGMRGAETQGQRITYYRAFLNVAGSEKARGVLKAMLTAKAQRRGGNEGGNPSGSEGAPLPADASGREDTLPTGRVSALAENSIPLKTKDKFDIVTRLLILGDPEAPGLLAALEKSETSDEAKRYVYAARAGIATAENKAKYWKDFTENKEISESWIEAAFGPWNSIRHSELTLPYLERALKELPNHKRNRKIFFVNGWLGAFIGGQRSEEALAIVNKFLADNPNLDRDLRLKILENADIIERAVKIRTKH